MTDWNQTLKDARAEHPDPMSDPRRTQRGRGWNKVKRDPPTEEQIIKNTIEWLGKQTQSHTLERKASAPDRVMDKAMQYHAAETVRRMAKHSAKPDHRGMLLTIAIMLPTCLCLGGILVNYVP